MADDPTHRTPIDRLVAPLREAILASVDPDDIVGRVDVNDIVARIDVNELLDRVDVDALLDRVDVDRLLDRVDVDRLLDRVDVDRLVGRVDVDSIVASSTRGVVGSMVDVVRRQLVGIDTIVVRTALRLRGIDARTLPDGPSALARDADEGRYDVTGRYAGPITRLLAYAGDIAIGFGLFTLLSAGFGYLAVLLFGAAFDAAEQSGPQWFVPLSIVGFAYVWLSVSVAGRTPAMAILGVRVVDRAGHPLSTRRAFVRTLVLPLSGAFVGLGFVGLFLGRERRALHDVAAGSTVVYDWGDRPASLPTPLGDWLSRHDSPPADRPSEVADG